MSTQMKNPRIIIDASYIRGMDESTAQSCFGTICERGGRIVLIDTLLRELFSSNQWPALQIKLRTCADSIEVWKHVFEMLRYELKQKNPYGDPLDEKTQEIRQIIFGSGPLRRFDAGQENEISNGITKLFKGLVGAQEFKQFAKEIKRASGNQDKLMKFCSDVVNNPYNIRLVIDIILLKSEMGSSLNPQDVDDTWVIWHFGKSLLTLFCDTQRKDEGSFYISESFKNASKNQERFL